MSARAFVDTNVLVYAHDTTAGEKHRRALALVAGFWETGTGCLSVQVLQEFYETVTRKVQNPMDTGKAVGILRDLAAWTVHAPGVEDIIGAIELQTRYGISFWDAMIVRSALSTGCDTLWSEDLNPGQDYDGVRVRNPFV